METFTNDQQSILEKAISKYLEKNRELILRRLLGIDKLEISAQKEITIIAGPSGKIVFKRE
jgi:hypothetical protein